MFKKLNLKRYFQNILIEKDYKFLLKANLDNQHHQETEISEKLKDIF